MDTDRFRDPADALAELRARLKAGHAAWGGTQVQLARRAGLGRTVVNQALSDSAPAPSAQTVAGLARALGLGKEVRSLLDLLATASGPLESPDGVVGRPIGDWDPHDLEVHPAVYASVGEERTWAGGPQGRGHVASVLPGYVSRPHDGELADLVAAAADGHSRMAVLVGSSSTGKTRACWEAVQPLAPLGWRLWHPFDPTRAEAALADLARVAPRTVVWLNEAQHYLGAGQGLGERITAAVHSLLTDLKRAPVLVLGTLWPEYANAYTQLPKPSQEDPYPQVRELLAVRRITLPDSFDTAATNAARAQAEAGDRQLAHALKRARDGRLTQYLAGAPELLHRYKTAAPPARALLHAAMDARRLGAGLHLPQAFLEHAAADYFTDDEYDTLADNWLEQALASSTDAVHGNLAPLRRIRRRTLSAPAGAAPDQPAYRLADYLEQHGRNQRKMLCPPASFWQAAHDRLTHPDSLAKLAEAAANRRRDRWAYHLWQKAADAGSTSALISLALVREKAGDQDGAEQLVRQAADAGDASAPNSLARWRQLVEDQDRLEQFVRRQDEVEQLARQAADTDAPNDLADYADALNDLAIYIEAQNQLDLIREETRARPETEQFARRNADAGYAASMIDLDARRENGDLWPYGLDPDGTPSAPWDLFTQPPADM
ncbi:hypothetical protein SAMN04490356_6543 [Streptomyces melanosporofaciens]|uniref:HTH cro/C1-type domain-containing protein n=1 Tax=Streptomyces melanosporofaciens TaxID=67327 RepID=A0A1H4X9B0_STRMJ|nr:hypothetical protein SAMN04490356_6543 [Streptomyces melanosporofaciens]